MDNYVTIADWDRRAIDLENGIVWAKNEIVDAVDRTTEINRRLNEMETKLNCRILMKKGLMKDKPEKYMTKITQGVYIDEQGELYLALDDKEKSWVEKELEKNIFLN